MTHPDAYVDMIVEFVGNSGEGAMTPAMVVLISPPCATTAAWSRVTPLLDALGVPNVAVQLPSCLPESDIDDAGFLRSVLDECGDPVVFVGHSSGGWELTEVGVHPSVKHLVYMDAVMWDVGESWAALLAGGVAEGWAACVRVRKDVIEFDTDAVAAYFLGRGWSAYDAQEFVAGFRPQRTAASVRSLTVAAWRTVPSTYISPNDSEMKRHLRELFASRATDVVEIPGDHFPNWRRPDEVADIFARTATSSLSSTRSPNGTAHCNAKAEARRRPEAEEFFGFIGFASFATRKPLSAGPAR